MSTPHPTLKYALEEYLARRARTARPVGFWSAREETPWGLLSSFVLDPEEWRACCQHLVGDGYGVKYWTHAHSVTHVAHLFGAPVTLLKAAVHEALGHRFPTNGSRKAGEPTVIDFVVAAAHSARPRELRGRRRRTR